MTLLHFSVVSTAANIFQHLFCIIILRIIKIVHESIVSFQQRASRLAKRIWTWLMYPVLYLHHRLSIFIIFPSNTGNLYYRLYYRLLFALLLFIYQLNHVYLYRYLRYFHEILIISFITHVAFYFTLYYYFSRINYITFPSLDKFWKFIFPLIHTNVQ